MAVRHRAPAPSTGRPVCPMHPGCGVGGESPCVSPSPRIECHSTRRLSSCGGQKAAAAQICASWQEMTRARLSGSQGFGHGCFGCSAAAMPPTRSSCRKLLPSLRPPSSQRKRQARSQLCAGSVQRCHSEGREIIRQDTPSASAMLCVEALGATWGAGHGQNRCLYLSLARRYGND
jgi:hypothetical protein